MESALASSLLSLATPTRLTPISCSPPRHATVPLCVRRSSTFSAKIAETRRTSTRVSAINDVTTVLDPAPVEITWQIIVGTIAGITPFVVAGIEFSKRIIAQRKCEECGGSGIVFRDKKYFRCPECGGFLPWQSWKRFFSG
ncbi:hypothetical protein HN51_049326 [Arachis hypogaea]|uniref:Viral late gene transcription factor 3 zinc ribbon domain-containing protein n=1 Tax=Arachis hypogaea TaxID=3818 RepID=A0A444YFG5_ARAHY|nr:uncharacterized protein LOC107608184 [Arachis ipaensis]XP_025666959.1 uncharacterized protein LOC112765258 [Arachis hypogaea]QHN91020.1 uncharacterized protein DS421_17g571360 [Arachis hypogaea]RYR00631.1 hypothetical protein Ahy_B07g088756 [Arachis hypogaea]